MQRGTESTEAPSSSRSLATLAPSTGAIATSGPLDWRAAAALIARVVAGDESALASLYDAYSAMLFTVALRVVRTDADAEEVVLDAFTQAWRDAARYDATRGSPFAWLVTICRTRALDHLRSRSRGARALDRAAADAGGDASPALAAWRPDPALDYEHRDRYARVAAAVSELPPVVREVVELVLTESLTHTELAERLGLPLGTVKTRMRTGLRLLRDALGASLLD